MSYKEQLVKLYINNDDFPMLFKLDKSQLGNLCYDIFKRGYESYFPDKDAVDKQLYSESIKYDLQRIQSDLNKANIDEKLDKFSNILENLLGITNSSSKKGEASENMIYGMIRAKFKDYALEETRHLPHNGDAILNIIHNDQNGSDHSDHTNSQNNYTQVMLEVKNYTKTVDRDEIDKLIYDMKYTHIRYAIIISLRSGFINRKQMSIQEFQYNDETYTIIFLPNLFGQIDMIEASIILVQRIIDLHNSRQNKTQSNLEIKWLYNHVIEHLKELDIVYKDFEQFKQKYYVLENSIKQNLHDYYFALRGYEMDIKNRINSIWKSINKDFDKAEEDVMNKDIIVEKISDLKKNTKFKLSKNISLIFEILMKNGYHISSTHNKKFWHVLDKDRLIIGSALRDGDILQINIIGDNKLSYNIPTVGNIKNDLVKLDTILSS